MKKELLSKIRNNQILYSYLREDSSVYKELLRDEKYLRVINEKAKEKYKVRIEDKIVNIQEKVNLLKTFMNLIE